MVNLTLASHTIVDGYEPSDEFLNCIDKDLVSRQTVITRFYSAEDRAESVIRLVQEVIDSCTRRQEFTDSVRDQAILDTIREFPNEAHQYAAYCIAKRRTPKSERSNTSVFDGMQEALSKKPMSLAQRSYLSKLGCDIEFNNSWEASNAISLLKSGYRVGDKKCS